MSKTMKRKRPPLPVLPQPPTLDNLRELRDELNANIEAGREEWPHWIARLEEYALADKRRRAQRLEELEKAAGRGEPILWNNWELGAALRGELEWKGKVVQLSAQQCAVLASMSTDSRSSLRIAKLAHKRFHVDFSNHPRADWESKPEAEKAVRQTVRNAVDRVRNMLRESGFSKEQVRELLPVDGGHGGLSFGVLVHRE